MATPAKRKKLGAKPPPTPEDVAAANLVQFSLSPSPFGAHADSMTDQMFDKPRDGDGSSERTSMIVPKGYEPNYEMPDVSMEPSMEPPMEPPHGRRVTQDLMIPKTKPPTPAQRTGRASSSGAGRNSSMGSGRNSSMGGARRQSDLWSEAEDELLRQGVAKHANKNWKSIADGLPHKTAIQCLHRWRKVLDPEVIKGPWTTAEDDKIRELVSARGPQKWSAIAKELPGRMGKQCRERWHNHLDPNIKKGPWTNAEVRRRTLLAKTLPAKNLTRCASARRRCASSVPTLIWATNGRRLPSSCPDARTTR